VGDALSRLWILDFGAFFQAALQIAVFLTGLAQNYGCPSISAAVPNFGFDAVEGRI
jgi:hypothetical protein